MGLRLEKIKEAWGGELPDGGIDDNGWSKLPYRPELIDYEKYDAQQYLEGGYIRPKSLKGIENNNGWISIDNEMKVDNGKYWVRLFNPETNIESFEVISVFNGIIGYYFATHYQPIIEPLKPLY